MFEITYIDTAVYLCILCHSIIIQFGFLKFFGFLFQHSTYLLFVLPYNVVLDRFLKPFEWQTKYNQRSSNFEYIANITIKQILKSLKPGDTGTALFHDRIHKAFYYYRVYTQGFASLGDTTFGFKKNIKNDNNNTGSDNSIKSTKSTKSTGSTNSTNTTNSTNDGVRGMWIYSKSNGFKQEFDLVLYYVPGGGFMMGSPYIYLEYLQCLLVVLQEQGFKNPAVFIQIFTPIPKGVYPYHLEETVKGWSYVLKENPTSNCIIIGDSTGATLILSLLLFLAKPNFEMINATESDINLTKPLAAFLISPIPKFNISDNIQKNHQNALEICPDILTKKIVNNWGKNYIPDFDFDSEENSENPENCGYHSPGLCNDEEWWKNAFPEFGIVISYGAEELLAPEIDFLTTNLKKFGKVKVDKHNAHVHDWPILTYFTERTQEDREESIQYFAGVISRMLLWNTETYFSSNAKEPTNILKIDYEYS